MINDCINKIICADSIEFMNQLPDNFVDLIVTSPPYNIGKKYFNYNDNLTWEDYHRWLQIMCRAMYRLIKPNSNIFINIADVGISNKDAKIKIGNRGNFHVIPNHVVVIEEMIKIGAQYLNPIIWKKISNCNTQFGANGKYSGTYPYPKNCHVPSELEYVLHFRKNGKYEKVDEKIKEISKVTKERWAQLSSQIWEFNGTKNKKHPAIFPIELPLRCIEGWSFVNDIVFDPFSGIGTTLIASKQSNRKYIGCDLSKEYCEIAEIELLKIKK